MYMSYWKNIDLNKYSYLHSDYKLNLLSDSSLIFKPSKKQDVYKIFFFATLSLLDFWLKKRHLNKVHVSVILFMRWSLWGRGILYIHRWDVKCRIISNEYRIPAPTISCSYIFRTRKVCTWGGGHTFAFPHAVWILSAREHQIMLWRVLEMLSTSMSL